MRRLLSFVLLAAFSLPLLAPMLALAQSDSEASLPMCCRRHGVHHCGMTIAAQHGAPTLTARCPMYPQRAVAPATSSLLAVATAPAAQLALLQQTLPVARAEASHRISRERSRHKRGPPPQLV